MVSVMLWKAVNATNWRSFAVNAAQLTATEPKVAFVRGPSDRA
jgi:hypothetical protein